MRLIFTLLLLFCSLTVWGQNARLTIEVNGLNNEEKKILLHNLSVKAVEKRKELTKEKIVNYYQLTREEISSFLESLGYYHPNIYSYLTKKDNNYLAKFDIEPGHPVLIHSVNIKLLGNGRNDPELLRLLKASPLEIGKPLNHQVYELYKQQLLSRALHSGYLDALFTLNKIELDPELNRAYILIELETGSQYKLGKVNFESPPYPSSYLQGYIPFKEGSPYTTENLVTFQKKLADSNLFNKIRIDPELNDSLNYLVPLNVRLTPKPKNKYTASAGFGTDTGIRGSVGWERRIRQYPGHHINLDAKSSKRLNQLSGMYSMPGRNPSTDKLVLGSLISEERFPDKKYSLRHETGISHLQRMNKIEQRLGLHYMTETFRKIPTEPKEHSHFLMPSIGLIWSDPYTTPSMLQCGTSISIKVRGGTKILLSKVDLLQGETRLKWIAPLGDLSRIILRGGVGATALAHTEEIPLSMRYFTGGDHSVRGYGFNSIGPRKTDSLGNETVIGGRYLIISSLEIDRRIAKKLSIATFVDAGNAMDKWRSRISKGAGVGFRYETPLGPLRVDFAKPFRKSRYEPRRKPRIHLTFGMDI